MKVRIKFSKQGEMRFIGHLDIQRYFQKAIRRCGIDIKFSEGMSPHMVMSFAHPLGVGLTSDGEYIDIEINTPIATGAAVDALNSTMCEGMRVLDFRQIEEGKASKAMSLVAAASYEVSFREGYEICSDWKLKIPDFLAQEHIEALKETKKGEAMVDIRPLIYDMKPTERGVFMFVSTGSANNLKPDLVMRAFAAWMGRTLPPFSLKINRLDVYADQGSEGVHDFISLNDLGCPIS